MVWILVLELWAVNEERIQLSKEPTVKHELSTEFAVYQQLGDMLASKLEATCKMAEKNMNTLMVSQNLTKTAAGVNLVRNMLKSNAEKEEPAD